jgi:hypothetical protein
MVLTAEFIAQPASLGICFSTIHLYCFGFPAGQQKLEIYP